MNVESLHIFPLKSGAGIDLPEAIARERGFAGDRRLMAIAPDGTFLSQRTHPRLGTVTVTGLTEGPVHLHAPVHGAVTLPDDGPRRPVTVWSDETDALDLGDEAAEWITAVLGSQARLVRMPNDADRPVEDVQVSFADGYPYLLTTVSSLRDLNERIDGPPVPMAAFRPNIVIAGAEPWAEDGWTRLRIGDAEFDAVKPCTRCKIPTLDPDAPDRPRADNEPLRTLATFRRGPDGVLFGENLICRTPGVMIHVGDPVTTL